MFNIPNNSTQSNNIANDVTKISKPIDIDVNDSYAINAKTHLTIPTYEGSGQATHPKIKYFNSKWNGYHYWMVMTPYPNADGTKENPSIIVSDDGITWEVPSGLVNPIEPQPATNYYSDPDLIMSVDLKTMYVIFRYTGGTDTVYYIKESIDGITWSEKVEIFRTLKTTFDGASPSVIWDGKQWVMWQVDLSTSPNLIHRRTSSSLYGTWSNSTTCSIATPIGYEPWHMEVQYIGSQFLMLLQLCVNDTAGGDGLLYLASSYDGVNWTLSEKNFLESIPSTWDVIPYKSTFIPAFKNDKLILKCWYVGRVTEWYIGYTEIQLDKTFMLNFNNLVYQSDLYASVNLLKKFVIGDTFTRVNSTTSIGTSTSGNTWSVTQGTFGILNNKAYAPLDTYAKAVFDIGNSNYEVSTEISTIGTGQAFLMFRFSGNSDFWKVGNYSGSTKIQKTVNNVTTDVGFMPSLIDGDVLKVRNYGNNIKIYINGFKRFEIDDSDLNTLTKVGLFTQTITAKFNSFYAKAL